MKSIFLCDYPDCPERVFSKETRELLSRIAGIDGTVYSKEYVLKHPESFADTDYIFSTWGMPQLSQEEITAVFPKLKCVFYAAGSVQSFARPFLSCGVKVFSAWAANAVPVAEYTVSQIILANKGFFSCANAMSGGNTEKANALKEKYHGNFGGRVGIIGAGMIGSLVAEMLKGYKLKVLVFDPFLSDERAKALNAEKCSLQRLFSECGVVSNHLANNSETRGMLCYDLFSLMPPYATFLNTGRGAQVIEDDLARVLSERPDLTAVLDVTDPEPPKAGHGFYTLSNCFITPHIAGSSGDEVCRMAEYMAEEFRKFTAGETCRYEVTEKMLETMA